MTLDERIQQLMELLAQVKLRGTDAPSSPPPPAEGLPTPARDLVEGAPFDAETTVVDDVVPDPAKPAPSAPESAPQESRSRLIAAQRSAVDYDSEDDGATPLDVTQEMAGAPGFASDHLAAVPIESGEERDPDGAPSHAHAGDPDAESESGDVSHPGRDLGSDLDAGLESEIEIEGFEDDDDDEGSPASSRRPVLPDDAAPVLPDLEWDDTSVAPHAPPESGPHMAASPLERGDSDVTGVRSAASFITPHVVKSEVAPLSPAPPGQPPGTLVQGAGVAELVGAVRSFSPSTFGELIDAALAL